MYYVTVVEVVEAFSDTRQLIAGWFVAKHKGINTHQTDLVRGWMVHDVFHQTPAWHRSRNELERIDDDAEKGDNIWVS